MLLGVMTLEAKPKYRIESWIIGGTRMYLPQQKVWLKTSMGTLPIKVWVSPDYPSQSKREAEEVIGFWKQNELDKELQLAFVDQLKVLLLNNESF